MVGNRWLKVWKTAILRTFQKPFISKAFHFKLGKWKYDSMVREENPFPHSSLELQLKRISQQ